MKIQVLHDAQGNIVSFAVVKSGSKHGLSMVPKAGQSIKMVNVPGIKGNSNDEKTFKRLIEAMSQHRVDVSSKRAKLIRKKSG